MKVSDTTIEAQITSGPDRFGLAIALFDLDSMSDEIRTAYFKLTQELGELLGLSIRINKMTRESGNQAKLWVFEGTIGPRTRQKSGYALSEQISGFYDLNTRTGYIRFNRI